MKVLRREEMEIFKAVINKLPLHFSKNEYEEIRKKMFRPFIGRYCYPIDIQTVALTTALANNLLLETLSTYYIKEKYQQVLVFADGLRIPMAQTAQKKYKRPYAWGGYYYEYETPVFLKQHGGKREYIKEKGVFEAPRTIHIYSFNQKGFDKMMELINFMESE